MLEKLKERWRRPESRKLFAVILAGKLLGVGAKQAKAASPALQWTKR